MPRFVVIDQDSYVPSGGDFMEEGDIVDRDGYRDVETMVVEMVQAGQRLDAFRRGYDFEAGQEGSDSTELQDISLARDFDPADITKLSAAAREEIREYLKKKDAEENKKIMPKEATAESGSA